MKNIIIIFLTMFLSTIATANDNHTNSEQKTTDLVLPRIDPEISTQFYQILNDIHCLLKTNSITHWLTSGSLLGAVRHQGMIPWDDDIDLAFLENDIATIISLKPILLKMGYEVLVLRDHLKIYPVNGHSIAKEDGGNYLWKYPFIDLFPMKQYGEKVSYASKRLYDSFLNDWFYTADLFPLTLAKFGSLIIPIPNHAAQYLERVYGKDVWEVAYANYNHSEEKKMSKVKVRLITKDYAPDLSLIR